MSENNKLLTAAIVIFVIVMIGLTAAIEHADVKNCNGNEACIKAVRGN